MSWTFDVSLTCRVAVGTVFAVSVIAKVHRPAAWRSFSGWLQGLPLRPLRPAGLPSALTCAEVAVAGCVAVPASALAGLVIGVAFSAALVAGLLVAIRRGARQPCHCFGASTESLGATHVVRAALLLVIAAAGAACLAASPARIAPARPGLGLVAGLAVAILVIFLGEVAALLAGDAPGREPGPAGRPVAR